MKKLIGIMAVAFMVFGLPVAHAAGTDDVTMTVMDVNDSHASDVTNEIEMPEQANEDAASSKEHEQESADQEQETEQQTDAVSEHSDDAHDASQDENESAQQETESQDN